MPQFLGKIPYDELIPGDCFVLSLRGLRAANKRRYVKGTAHVYHEYSPGTNRVNHSKPVTKEVYFLRHNPEAIGSSAPPVANETRA